VPASTPLLPALTVGQPVAWTLVEGHRNLLNLRWEPPDSLVGSALAIHVVPAPADMRPVLALLKDLQHRLPGTYVPGPRRLTWGSFVAVAKVQAVWREAPRTGRADVDGWWSGPFGIELGGVTPVLPPLPAVRQGKGIWRVLPGHLPVLRERYQNGRHHLQRELERARRRADDLPAPMDYEEQERAAMQDEETG